jgi:tetratricopeptide (TPR) repeat protein
MNKRLLAFLILLLLPSIDLGQPNAEELSVKEAERVYLSYNEDLNNLGKAIDQLNKILDKDPSNLEALILLSRIWLTYGDVIAKDKGEKLRAFEKGRDIAQKAIELSQKNLDAHFWYTANIGRWGQTMGVLKSLSLLSQVREQINLILSYDPKYIPALDVYGVLYYELPRFLGGDLNLSERYLRQALELDPSLTAIRIDLARVLIKRKRYEEARVELNRVLEEKQPTFYADWYVKDRKAAKELLVKLKGK